MFIEDVSVLPVPLGLELVVGDESKGGRVDAVPEATLLGRAVIEDMAEMAVALGRTNFGPDHPVRPVDVLHHVLPAPGAR